MIAILFIRCGYRLNGRIDDFSMTIRHDLLPPHPERTVRYVAPKATTTGRSSKYYHRMTAEQKRAFNRLTYQRAKARKGQGAA